MKPTPARARRKASSSACSSATPVAAVKTTVSGARRASLLVGQARRVARSLSVVVVIATTVPGPRRAYQGASRRRTVANHAPRPLRVAAHGPCARTGRRPSSRASTARSTCFAQVTADLAIGPFALQAESAAAMVDLTTTSPAAGRWPAQDADRLHADRSGALPSRPVCTFLA